MKARNKSDSSVEEGTTLLTEKPFVYVLKSKLREERCDYCFKRGLLRRCSCCQYVYYCNRECQKEAWIDHKPECCNFRRMLPRIVPDAARFMARIIFKLKRGGDQEEGFYTKNKFRKFKDLMSHYSDLKQDKKRMEHFVSLCAVLVDFIGESNLPNSAELMGIYGRMCVNGFNILDPEMLSIGTGLYLGVSVVDHSCDPNAVAVFEGTAIHIRAIKRLPALDWSKIFISYIDLLNFPEDRQRELQSTYYFLCQCVLCTDDALTRSMSVAICSRCQGPVPVPRKDNGEPCLECPACGTHLQHDTYQEYLEVGEFVQDQLHAMKDMAYLDVCKVCLKKQQGVFHPEALLRVKVLDLAFESSIEMGQWEEAREFGAQLLPGYRRYLGDKHPLLGLLLLKLGKINLFLGKNTEALKNLQEAQSVIKITHGETHSLYCRDLQELLHQAHSATA